MSKKFKAMSLIIAGFMGITMLSGCGSTSSGKNKSSDDEIIVWSYLMDNEVEEVDKIAQEWAQENNKKVTVVKDNSDFDYTILLKSGRNPSTYKEIMEGIEELYKEYKDGQICYHNKIIRKKDKYITNKS